MPEDKIESVTSLAFTAGGNGAMLDVATEDLDTSLASQEYATNVNLEVLKALSLLQERDQSRKARFEVME